MYTNYVDWISTKKENPDNSMPLTVVVRGLNGAHTYGAYYKDTKWYDIRTNKELTEEVICWSNISIPNEFIF